MKNHFFIPIFIFIAFLLLPGMETFATEKYPKVVLDSYIIDSTHATYGEETTISLDFVNKSNDYSVSEVLITFTSGNNTVLPVQGISNQVYIESISPGGKETVTIPIVLEKSSTGYAHMSFTMQYTVTDSSDGTSSLQSNSAFIMFPMNTLRNLSITNFNIPSSVQVNSSGLVSANYSNDSARDIYNVHMQIMGIDDGDIQQVNIGNIAAGQSGYFENYVQFNNPGIKKVSINFIYEDENGKLYETEAKDYILTVYEKQVSSVDRDESIDENTEDGVNNTAESNSNGNISLIILCLVVVLILICVILAIKNIRTKK